MTTKQIDCFLSVASTLNFSRSAQELYASQSTVSRQISLLEDELGFRLFVRGNNYVRLTPSGITMLQCFSQIKRIRDEAVKKANLQNDGATGFLSLCFYSNMFIEDTLVQIINEFHQNYPNIILTYECIPFGNLDSAIRDGNFDLIFVHDFDELNSSEFVSENVCLTHQYLIYGNCHPNFGKRNLSLLDFKDDIFWTVEHRASSKRDNDISKIMKFYNIENPRMETAPNFETVLLNIRLGNGVIFMDPITHPHDPRYYSTLDFPEEISRIGIDIAWLKSNYNPAIPLFVNKFIR